MKFLSSMAVIGKCKARTRGGAAMLLTALIALAACSTPYNPLNDYEQVTPAAPMNAPEPATRETQTYSAAQVEHGRYLVELLGCATCHTNGALIGTPVEEQLLAGSNIGIAYTNPLAKKYPGVVFPANLTPDPDTGLGRWTDEQIIGVIHSGSARHGPRDIVVMPWQAYSKLSRDDTVAIVAYLRSLTPVRHRVPASVPPGRKTDYEYVHFGIYQSR